MGSHAQFLEGTIMSSSKNGINSKFCGKDDVEGVMSSKISSSTAKASRILGESEEIVLRQQIYLPLYRRTHEAFPDVTNESTQSNSQHLRLDPKFLPFSSTIRRKRTCSAPASSTRTSLAGGDIQALDTRRSTVVHTGSATFGPRSTSEPTTPPSGRERRRSSVASNLRLVIQRARSVKKKLQDKKLSRELESPVIEESGSQQGDLNAYVRGRSFSLDLPLHVSQDRSEIEYIRRKNRDAYMGRNSDIPLLEDSVDEQVIPFVPVSEALPELAISLLDGATTENQLPGLDSTAKTQTWNTVDYHPKSSHILPARSTITGPMSPDESRTFNGSSTADTASKKSEEVGTIEPLCNKAVAESFPKCEELRLNNEAGSKSETRPATFQETAPITTRLGSKVPQRSSNPKTARRADEGYQLYKSTVTQLDLKQRKERAKIFSKLTESPTNWELWTFTAEDMKEV
ncbi:hypothetical protein BKA64DRAFT_713478 [Cadophora sp. MPI-SDFR-AT-0126]|nr:hypothetical protein BKA64DRAFT_713478 [Leotiomycetes sp. MPI-SDFR-AT-0126]